MFTILYSVLQKIQVTLLCHVHNSTNADIATNTVILAILLPFQPMQSSHYYQLNFYSKNKLQTKQWYYNRNYTSLPHITAVSWGIVFKINTSDGKHFQSQDQYLNFCLIEWYVHYLHDTMQTAMCCKSNSHCWLYYVIRVKIFYWLPS